MSCTRSTDHITTRTCEIAGVKVEIQSGWQPDDNWGRGTGQYTFIAKAFEAMTPDELAEILVAAKLLGEPVAGDLFFGEEGWFGARIIEHSSLIIIRWALKENCPFQTSLPLVVCVPELEEKILEQLFEPVG